MTFHEFAVILQSLLDRELQDFLPESDIRDIWVESNALPHLTFHDDKFKNLGINLLKKITSLSPQRTTRRAMLFDIAYRMIISHATWLFENPIKHIYILSNIVSAWTECGGNPSDNILPTLESVLDQVGSPTEVSSRNTIMSSYLIQALYAAKSDLKETSLIYYNRAFDILNLNSQELRNLKINYVYSFSLKIALELCNKDAARAIKWLNQTVGQLKECNASTQEKTVNIYIACYQKIKNELSLEDVEASFALLEDIEVMNEPKSCLCHILILSKLPHNLKVHTDKMKDTFMRKAETIRIKDIDDLKFFTKAIKIAFHHTSLEIVMKGVDLITQRYRDMISIGKLLLYKIHLFTDLVRDKYVEFGYKGALKSLMDEVMIDKQDILPIDMESILLLCWSIGDYHKLRNNYSDAYEWFNYGLQCLDPSDRSKHHKKKLVENLAICCVNKSPSLAFEHAYNGLGDDKTAIDYLLLLKYCIIKNNDIPMFRQLLDELVASKDFEREFLADVIYYIQKYNSDINLLEYIIKAIMELSGRNEGQVLELVTVHLLVLVIRCVAEFSSFDQQMLNLPAIASSMKQLCQILCSDDKLEDYTAEDEIRLRDDLDWLLKAAYHLSQHVQENHDLFIQFLDIINWVSNLFDKLQYCSVQYTSHHLYIIMYTKLKLFYSLDDNEKEQQGYYCIGLDSIKLLKKKNDQMNLQVMIYEIEVLLHRNMIDTACDMLKEYTSNSGCSPIVLKQLTNMVIQNKSCSVSTSVALLKSIQSYYYDHNYISDYAKWTNVLVSHLEESGELNKIYEVIHEASAVVQAHYGEYPQEELFYLLSISWNQGVMRFKKGAENPYCKLAMVLADFIEGQDEIIEKVKSQYLRMTLN